MRDRRTDGDAAVDADHEPPDSTGRSGDGADDDADHDRRDPYQPL